MEEAGQWVELQLDGGKVFVFYGTVWWLELAVIYCIFQNSQKKRLNPLTTKASNVWGEGYANHTDLIITWSVHTLKQHIIPSKCLQLFFC
jgi:hypothetical protein